MGTWAATKGPASAGPHERHGLPPPRITGAQPPTTTTWIRNPRVSANMETTPTKQVDGRIPRDNATVVAPQETTPHSPEESTSSTPPNPSQTFADVEPESPMGITAVELPVNECHTDFQGAGLRTPAAGAPGRLTITSSTNRGRRTATGRCRGG